MSTLPTTKDPANTGRGGISGEALQYYYNPIGQLTGSAGNLVYVADTIYSPWGEVSQHVLGINDLRATLTYDRDRNTHRVNHVDFSGLLADPQISDLTYTLKRPRFDAASFWVGRMHLQRPTGRGRSSPGRPRSGPTASVDEGAWTATHASERSSGLPLVAWRHRL